MMSTGIHTLFMSTGIRTLFMRTHELLFYQFSNFLFTCEKAVRLWCEAEIEEMMDWENRVVISEQN